MHALGQCFLPELLYFHIHAASSHNNMIKEPEKTNKEINDHLINLS